ncbi:helix-turn-helix transcriptional regulator [Methylobacterium soli]|uniref:DNA-binding protein n=1 Tax=Methylobacterium soli TaxID=553447 RepID=A0A6L3SZN9_9HYPH|nr:DNA-binding protein [Methylobacterium soli]KAB1075945.1 DNA-binding protein [Methylobacterium soli]GJE46131.1 hypothetical protein AEGHOMDF_5331 [Methylobacterium soli]
MQTGQEVLRPHDLVERWGGIVSVRTLANWRSQSIGPRYVKYGGRIGYKEKDVLEWENKRTVEGTSDYIR